MAKMWDARFSKAENSRVNDFNSSISFDSRMFREDIEGSMAHATMLGRCGIISLDESAKIVTALAEIRADLESGKLAIDPEAEDIHMFDSRSGIRYMLYGFTNDHKNALVAAQYRTQDTLHFALPETPVFCYQESLSKVPYIVFSDNPIFAEAIQRHLEREPSWSATSFLQKSDLKDLDFSVFSGKTVIYYLVEHSGDDWRTSCLNALDIIDRFPEDTTVYVMSYPETNNCPDIAKYPVFLSTKQQFEKEVEELKLDGTYNDSSFSREYESE